MDDNASTDIATSPAFRAALDYIERGWSPIPLHWIRADGECSCGRTGDEHARRQGGKHPIEPKWQTREPASPADAWSWWGEQWPEANIGLVTGRTFWVLDVDPDNGGDQTLAALLDQHGQTAADLGYAVVTGSGGMHVYFAMPDGWAPTNANRLGRGLDCRGVGGQVVAPPSVSGKGTYGYMDGEIGPAPDWLLDLVRPAAGQLAIMPAAVEDLPAYVDQPPHEQERLTRYALQALRSTVAGYLGAARGTGDVALLAAACSIIEITSSPWNLETTEAWYGQLDQARARRNAQAAVWGGGQSDQDMARVWRSALSRTAGRGRAYPADGSDGLDLPDAFYPATGSPTAEVAPSADNPIPDDIPDESEPSQYDDSGIAGPGKKLLREAVHQLRLRDAAREYRDAEVHAGNWRPPSAHGNLADELMIPRSAQRWALHGLLPAGGNAVLIATRKAGKTTMTGNLIRALADETPFLGRFAVEACERRIAAFNYEVGPDQYREWLGDMDIGNAERVSLMHLRGETLPIANHRVRKWLIDWLEERDIGTWIIDPYSRAMLGSVENENDNGAVGKFLDLLDQIKSAAGVDQIVMPAHTPKALVESGDETARGAARLEDWADALWYVTKDKLTGDRFMRAEGRDVEVGEEQLTYKSDTRELRLGGWDRAGVAQQRDIARFIEYISGHPGCTQNDLETDLGMRRDKIKSVRTLTSEKVEVRTVGKSYTHWIKGTFTQVDESESD